MSEQDQSYPQYPSYPGDANPPPVGTSSSPSDHRRHLGHVPTLGPLPGLTIAAAIAFTLANTVGVLFVFQAQETWRQAAADGRSALDVFTAYDVLAVLLLPTGIGAYVVTCLFLSRVRATVDALDPAAPQARSAGWVWGGWLVPVVNLWFPFQVVRDLLRPTRRRSSLGPIVGWWWAFWIAALVMTQVESRLAPWEEIDTEAVNLLGPVAVVAAALLVVACVLWIRVVRLLVADQRTLRTDAGLNAA